MARSGQKDRRKARAVDLCRDREKLIEEVLSVSAHCNAGTLEELEQLDDLLTRLIDIERRLDIKLFHATSDRQASWKPFLEWCSSNHVDTSKIEIVRVDDAGDEYGLHATVDLAEDDLLLEIPRKLMLTSEDATADAKLAQFVKEDAIVQTMPNVLLALQLLNERCKIDSHWRPYLNIMPNCYQTPLYLTAKELSPMKHSPWFAEVVKLRRSIARQYSYFWKQMFVARVPSATALPFKSFFTYDLYRWAVSTVMTRQNFVPSQTGNGMVNALIPLWDMCNHSSGRYSTDYDVSKAVALCYTMKPFKKGEEITIFYGKRANGEFFLHNGFVYSNHQDDFLLIKLGISKADPLAGLRTALCNKISLPTAGMFKLYAEGRTQDEQLLAFLHIHHMTKDQLDRMLEDDSVKLASDVSQAAGLDAASIRKFIQNRCLLLLRTYQLPNECCNPLVQQLLDSEKKILQSHSV